MKDGEAQRRAKSMSEIDSKPPSGDLDCPSSMRKHGVRMSRPMEWIDDLMRAVGLGQRWEILRLLAEKPMSVGDIAGALFLRFTTASHHLRVMDQAGLISVTRIKNQRVYRLTDRVRVLRKAGALQFAIGTENGQWMLLQLETSESNCGQPQLPEAFVEGNGFQMDGK